MRRTALTAGVLALAILLQCPHAQAADEKKAAPTPEQVQAALKGFKGFLVGEIVGKDKAGVTLRIKALTLLKGCTAPNPSLAIGQTTPVLYATEKDGEGNEKPAQKLVDAIEHIEEMPAIAFGGFGGNNAVVVMDVGKGKNAAGLGGAVQTMTRTMTRTMTMRINGNEIKLGGGDDDDDDEDDANADKGKPKGPVATARVKTDDQGRLVMDRVMPGGQSYAAWNAMPKLRFANKKPEAKPIKPPKKDADF